VSIKYMSYKLRHTSHKHGMSQSGVVDGASDIGPVSKPMPLSYGSLLNTISPTFFKCSVLVNLYRGLSHTSEHDMAARQGQVVFSQRIHQQKWQLDYDKGVYTYQLHLFRSLSVLFLCGDPQ
jgi:hypothetical protein